MQAWSLGEDTDLHRISSSSIGHFYTGKVHVVWYMYQKQSSLYTWMEGMVYVWIGAKVKGGIEEAVKMVQEKLQSIGAMPNMVRIIQ